MEHREQNIFRILLESEKFAYIPADESDLYALAPPDETGNIDGLVCIPGEYQGMSEDQITTYALEAMQSGNWKFIPLQEE